MDLFASSQFPVLQELNLCTEFCEFSRQLIGRQRPLTSIFVIHKIEISKYWAESDIFPSKLQMRQ